MDGEKGKYGKGFGWLLALGICVFLSTVDLLLWWRITMYLAMHQPSTVNGYLDAAKTFDPEDLNVDISGRSYLITGANSGIGKSAALALAKKGGTIHMVCRNPDRAKKAKSEIVAKSGNKDVHTHILDISNIGNIHRFVQEFKFQHQKLDVLINNAACMVHKRTLTSESLELSFATNTMGYYALTMGLLPLLETSRDARVVMVSSAGLLLQELVVHDLQHENTTFVGDRVYNRQKRHQLVMAEELAKLHPNIHFSTMDPGWVDTPSLKKALPDFYNSVKGKLRNPDQGADTVVWLAASESSRLFENGLFYRDRKPVATHLSYAFTRETVTVRKQLMKDLHELSEQLKPLDSPHPFFINN